MIQSFLLNVNQVSTLIILSLRNKQKIFCTFDENLWLIQTIVRLTSSFCCKIDIHSFYILRKAKVNKKGDC